MKSLTDINIEKSRSGIYKDTSENRRLHRVGQRYGSSQPDPKPEFVLRGKIDPVNDKDWEKKASGIDWEYADMASVGQTVAYLGKVDNSEKPYAVRYYSPNGKNSRVMRLTEVDYKRNLERDRKLQASLEKNEGGKSSIPTKDSVKVKYEEGLNRNESSEKESRARELARVRAMTNDELAAEYLGYDADRYKKADKDFKEARSSFVKKWGDGLEGMISHISSMKDIEELLKDSTALLEKQRLVFDSSPFTSKTLAALRTRITNAAKKGKDIKNLSGTMSVEPERGFWKDKDFLAKIGEKFASNLIKDSKYTNNAKMGNTLFWTESDLKYDNKLELSAEEHNKLASIIAGEQGDPENYNKRGGGKIGGFEDFKNVVEGLRASEERRNLEETKKTNKKVDEIIKQGNKILQDTLKKEHERIQREMGTEGKFSRVNLADIPNAHKVNLTKYLSAKRKKAVDDAWGKAKFDSLPREKAGVFQEGYNKLREQFNNNFDNMSKSERAELLYKILKMKNAMERK